MRALTLYLLLLKATMTTFSGLASLPILRHDLVSERHMLTDHQLETAIVVTRTTPGPVGLYVVSIGYLADGVPGACAGWLAMVTPAFLIIPLLKFLGRRAEHPRVKSAIQAVVLSSAGLLWAATVPLAIGTATDAATVAILVLSTAVLLSRKVESVWVILGAAVCEITASALHVTNF